MPEHPPYNPIAAGNPFRKRGIDPRTGKPIKPQEPGEFVGKYLGPKAAKAVQELLANDKAKKKTAEVDLNSLMTEEEKAALEAREKALEIGKEFALTIGAKTGAQYTQELKDQGHKISGVAQELLNSPAFEATRLKTPQTIDLTKLTLPELAAAAGPEYVERLKEKRYLTAEEIYQAAAQVNLDTVPAEVGPALRLAYKDQPKKEWLFVGMEPIEDRYGDPGFFQVERPGDGKSRLSGDVAGPDNQWHPKDQFIFRRRK